MLYHVLFSYILYEGYFTSCEDFFPYIDFNEQCFVSDKMGEGIFGDFKERYSKNDRFFQAFLVKKEKQPFTY